MAHYYAIIDFECTCWERMDTADQGKLHEIIEFPVVFLNSKTLQVDFEFHSYVRPIENPVLSPFCVQLTGIEQSQVQDADDLTTVLKSFSKFLIDNRIEKFTPCTDGPWDILKFLGPETKRKAIQFPKWAQRWIDIRLKFKYSFGLESWIGVESMLEYLGLEFKGRPHSGIDDARNIARIVRAVHQKYRKGVIKTNRRIDSL